MEFVNALDGVFMLVIGIAVLVAVARLGEIRDELREQSRVRRGSEPAARWGGKGIRLDDPAEGGAR